MCIYHDQYPMDVHFAHVGSYVFLDRLKLDILLSTMGGQLLYINPKFNSFVYKRRTGAIRLQAHRVKFIQVHLVFVPENLLNE